MSSKAREDLARTGKCLFRTSGSSMEPLLHHHRSFAQIRRTEERLKVGDVALFERPDGMCVLHRVVRVKKDGYIILGDNSLWMEPVSDNQILGVMEGFYPDMETPYVDCCKDADYLQQVRRAQARYHRLWRKELPRRAVRKLKRVITG